MFRISILFWCVIAASFVWGGSVLVNLKVAEFYHPMAVRGDLFVPLHYGSIVLPVLPVLAAVGMLGCWDVGSGHVPYLSVTIRGD